MTPEIVRQKILRMRASQHSWEEIAEATKLPKTTGFQRFVIRRYDCNVPWSDFKANNYRPEGLQVQA